MTAARYHRSWSGVSGFHPFCREYQITCGYVWRVSFQWWGRKLFRVPPASLHSHQWCRKPILPRFSCSWVSISALAFTSFITIVILCLGISSNSIRNWPVFSFLYRCYLWTYKTVWSLYWSVSFPAWSWWVCCWEVSTPSYISLYPSREWRQHPHGVSCHLFLNITLSPLY